MVVCTTMVALHHATVGRRVGATCVWPWVEANACLEGLQHLLETRRLAGIVETNCQRVVQAVTVLTLDRSPSWSIYMEIRDLLHTHPMLEIRQIRRGSNKVARSLAQLGKLESSGALSETAPAYVLELIAKDCKNCVL